jgi:uncharacterized UBP type Zn finger protein
VFTLGKSATDVFIVAVTNFNRHYVAFVRELIPELERKSWVLFNDEKVVSAEDIEDMKKFAYVYFFERL